MAQTSTPKKAGLTIGRNKNKVIIVWTPIKNCKDQDIKVYVNNKLVGTHDLGASTQKYTYTIDRSKWYPNSGKKKLTEIAFKLARKQSGKTESKYSDQKEFKILAPRQPSFSPVTQDNTYNNVFTYSWGRNNYDGNLDTTKYMFTKFVWQTCLVSRGKDPKWSLADTQKITTINPTTGTRSTNQPSKGEITSTGVPAIIIVENQSDINDRKKRCFRVKAVGPAGYSTWRTHYHNLGGFDSIYIPPENTSFIGTSSTGTRGSIIIPVGTGYVGDSLEVQYAITSPSVETEIEDDYVINNLSLPDDYSGWGTADVFVGTLKSNKYTFNVPDRVVDNTALFIRVNRIHDGIVSYGEPTLMNYRTPTSGVVDESSEEYLEKSTTVSMKLSRPLLSSVSTDPIHKTVTVEVENTSGIEGSFVAVYQSTTDGDADDKIIGIIPYNGSQVQTFQGDWGDDESPDIGIRCFVADYTPTERLEEGVTTYTLGTIYMDSLGIVWESDLVGKPPVITSLVKHDNTTAKIAWEWTWAQADSVEISWSDNEIMWEATDTPASYIVSNTRNGSRYITGLAAGTYYFRVRFIKTDGDTVVYGKYSDIATLEMSAAPSTPSLTLSDEDGVVALTDTVTAYWKYKSNDGTAQSDAWLGEATRVDDESPWTYTRTDVHAGTDTHIEFTPEQLGWTSDSTHYVSVTLRSASGKDSEGWSQPKRIVVAPEPVIDIQGLGGENDALTAVDDDDEAYKYKLTRLPLEFSVSGFGGNGYCTVVIERAADYIIERPDDTTITGFEGETIISQTFRPDSDDASDVVNISLDADDIKQYGRLDNTAQYLMTVTIVDEYGQTAKEEYPFTVVWDYYAQNPSANIVIDQTRDIAIITPSAPETPDDGDYCQIYRMSADKPQLILDEGDFDEDYVDIYPTYGRFGGYRIVYVTKYGDYKTEDNILAMTEYSKSGNDEDIDQYDKFLVSIQFDDNLVEFPGNISLSNSWAKDFQTTKYLGGSIQGDWNAGVQRTGTINGTVPVEYEAETVYGLRILADHAGICHVRTPEGSNFYGDVQVKDDREEKWVNRISKISLSYTKVDHTEEALPTLTEWEADNPQE